MQTNNGYFYFDSDDEPPDWYEEQAHEWLVYGTSYIAESARSASDQHYAKFGKIPETVTECLPDGTKRAWYLVATGMPPAPYWYEPEEE